MGLHSMGLHRYARIVDDAMRLVKIDFFVAAGVLAGERLLVSAFREGAHNLYAYDGSSLTRLNVDPINMLGRPPHGAARVVFGRDVAAGRELAKLYVVEVDRPGREVELHPEQRPARILGVADDGATVAYTAVHETGMGVYAVRDGRLWKAVDLAGFAFLAGVKGSLAMGFGVFPPDRYFKLFVVDLDAGRSEVYSPPIKGNVVAGDIAPDGTVTYGVEGAKRAALYRLDPDRGASTPLELRGDLASFDATSIGHVAYLPSGELVVIAKKNGRSRVFLDGKGLDAPEGTHYGAHEWRGRLAVTHSDLATPYRVVALDRGGGWEVVLEGERPQLLGDALGDRGFVQVKSLDGEAVPTLYLESRRIARPGPTVVLVHGGPFAEDDDSWDLFAVALSAAGFHVVKPNYRGSVGHGVEWTEKIVGDPCGMELEDVIAAAQWAKDSGLASRVYIMGYSYGGYMTLCALTRRPGTFSGGVAGASVVDWRTMYELSDPAFRSFIDMLFAGRAELWEDRSPATHVENLRDPLTLIHPQNDSRTPLIPVLRFVERASGLGKGLEVHIAPDMGHMITREEDVVKVLLPALLFLARLEGGAQ